MQKLLLTVVLFGLVDVILTAMPEGPPRERREIQELALMSPNALGAVPAPPTAQLLMRIQKRSQPEEQDRLRRTPKPTSIPVIIGPLKTVKPPRNRRAPKPTSIVRLAIATTPKPKRIRRAPKPRSIPVIIGNITAPRNRRAPKPTSIVRLAIATTPKPKRIRRAPKPRSIPVIIGNITAPRNRRAPKPTSIVRIAIATTPKPKRIRRAPKPTSIVRLAIATTPKPKRVRRDFDIPASTAPVRAGRSALSAILEPRIRRNPKPPRSRRTPAPTSRPKTCCRV